jgi:hypothetical protein
MKMNSARTVIAAHGRFGAFVLLCLASLGYVGAQTVLAEPGAFSCCTAQGSAPDCTIVDRSNSCPDGEFQCDTEPQTCCKLACYEKEG